MDAPLIVNGICVRWKGSINLEKLDGVGGFRFDDDAARVRATEKEMCKRRHLKVNLKWRQK